nr:crosslink repair DNA glycosylase YcaQ family protein [Parafrankia elaeagni]
MRERSGPAGRLSAEPEPEGPEPAPAPALPAPRLLGSFDPVLHGWVSRDWIVGGHQSVVTTNGIFRPIALVDGKAVATWAMPGGTVELTPFAPLSDEVTASLRADAADVRRFLGH